jgi:hypothetical protein
MKPLKIGLTLMLALAGGAAEAQPLFLPAAPAAPALVITVGCDGTGDQQLDNAQRQVRRQGNCDPGAVSSSSGNRVRNRDNNVRNYSDCHRDVRTHRIYGVMVKHRHVGDDCQVREVRSVN